MVFRDNFRACPRCGAALEETFTSLQQRFEQCSECRGNWVELITLRDMFQRMQPGFGMPVFESRSDDTPVLGCPMCSKPMRKSRLYKLDLDHCDGHGVWFDGKELEQTLYRYVISD